MSFWQQVKAAGAVAALAAVPACGSTSHSSSPRPTSASNQPTQAPTHSPTATPTMSPSASTSGRYPQAYVNGFEDFWVAYAHADADAMPNSQLLSQHATGAALAWARKQIEDHVKLGVSHRGTAHFRSVGAEHVTATSALVGQCMDWSGWPVVNRKTGVTFQRFPRYSQLVSGQMSLLDGQWKLATIQVQAAAC